MADAPRNYDAEIAALVRDRDMAALDNLKAVQTVLKRPAFVQAIADIEALLPKLPDDGTLNAHRTQVNNVVSVANGVRAMLDREVARVQSLMDGQAA